MEDFCRTCLIFFSEKVEKYSLLKNCAIKAAPGRLELLKSIFRTLSLSLVLNEESEISNINICKTCVVDINNMLNFLEKCLQSDATIKQAFVCKEDKKLCHKNFSKKTEGSFQPKVKIKIEVPNESNTNQVCIDAEEMPSNEFSKLKIPTKQKKDKFECKECQKNFSCILSLKIHRFEHDNFKPLVCKVCNKSFRTLPLIRKHMANEHENISYPPFKCRECLQMFTTKKLLNRHEVVRHNKKLFTCNSCKKIFASISTLKFHENIHSSSSSVNYVCSETFPDLPLFKDSNLDLKSKAFECRCGQIFNRKKKLDLHVESVHKKMEKPRKYSCTECDKKFLHPYSLKNHLNTHLGIKPYLCNMCGASFSALSNLTSHFRRIHTEKQPVAKTFLCHNCGNSFARASHLKRHNLRKHVPNAEKKYECPICKKKFLEKSDVKGHIKLHDDSNPFACDQCSKCFRTSWRLQAHIKRVHLGLRPFECPTCNVKFKTKSHLEKHIRTHTGEKPFPCPYCAYTCAEKSNLKKHINVHLKSI